MTPILTSIVAPCAAILTPVLAAAAPILPSIHAHRLGLSLGYRYTRGGLSPETAPNPTRASAFRRDIASGLAISVMSTLHVRRPMLPKLTSPVLTCVSPEGAPDTALPPDERITSALGNDLIERDIQVKDCEQRNKGSPPQTAGYFGRGPTSGSCGASGTPRTLVRGERIGVDA